MNSLLKDIYYSPVKSLSFIRLEQSKVKKKLGILNDRLFAFSRNISLEKSKLIEKYPEERNLNNFLTLKNSPTLNKYNFTYINKQLTLKKENHDVISILSNNLNQFYKISNKLNDLESSLSNPTFLMKNKFFPFFDTTHSKNIANSISLINLNSIIDLEKKSGEKIEFQRFRSNLYINGIEPWQERTWLNKNIKINNILFKVEKHIARCSATNLKPNSDNVTINLPMTLKKIYNHIDMGIYITPLEDGEINIGDQVVLS
tara:strand:+ start:216 stop:992 length:777 start_codon:yes stop_codon:yes gene_type:complete